MKRMLLGLFAFSAMLFLGFTGAAAARYEVIPVQNGGTVKGVVTWKGDVPEIAPITVLADIDVCGESVQSPVVQVDPQSKGLRFVLVYLEKVEQGKAPEPKYWLHMGKSDERPTSVLCNFEEHVFPFVRTQRVAMINFDEILHNPHFFDDKHRSLFNIAMPTPNLEIDHTILREHGVGWRFQCDVHVQMNGYAAGFDHPYFAVTDSHGRFEITDIPAGKYTLVGWHEGYNLKRLVSGRPLYDDPEVIRKEIEVKPGGTMEVNFTFPVQSK